MTLGTIRLIKDELAGIPEEYQKNFNSVHEGYGVLLEEVRELESEIFFGKKKAKGVIKVTENHLAEIVSKEEADHIWKHNIRMEAVQVAAMAVRIIQELT